MESAQEKINLKDYLRSLSPEDLNRLREHFNYFFAVLRRLEALSAERGYRFLCEEELKNFATSGIRVPYWIEGPTSTAEDIKNSSQFQKNWRFHCEERLR